MNPWEEERINLGVIDGVSYYITARSYGIKASPHFPGGKSYSFHPIFLVEMQEGDCVSYMHEEGYSYGYSCLDYSKATSLRSSRILNYIEDNHSRIYCQLKEALTQ